METIVIAILAKDKAHCLPAYLKCLEQQTWPATQTHIYIRTNNNKDETLSILQEWVSKVQDKYLSTKLISDDVPEPVQEYAQHEWNAVRFKVLGEIRDASVKYAQELNSHYFVADCDNFITPETLSSLVKTNLPAVGPLLRRFGNNYANYHDKCCKNGYMLTTDEYFSILDKRVRGLIVVDVIHCTYLLRNEILDKVSYQDGSGRYEYVILSDGLRKAGVLQYLDNREYYGMLTMAETKEELEREPWYAGL
jgi:hypothetical protein